MIETFNRLIIEDVQPAVDGGRFPVKREVGDILTVSADIYKDGHDILSAVVKFREKGGKWWYEQPMIHICNDRWEGSFDLVKNTRYEYTIEAYTQFFMSWRQELEKKKEFKDLTSEFLEGIAIIEKSVDLAISIDKDAISGIINKIKTYLNVGRQEDAIRIALGDELKYLMLKYPDRSDAKAYDTIFEVHVDTVKARFAAWYEMFPRSQGRIEGKSGTFKDCEKRLTDIKRMGFDVIYFPPIHPIGQTNKKGPNNTLNAKPEDPGCPYAIGNVRCRDNMQLPKGTFIGDGGHKDIEPLLGTFEDFENFRQKCRQLGFDIALDFAINCSPDHPYVKDHPEWFYKRPDGTIKYAENPPKRYEDIYPLNFECEEWQALWQEMLNVILFWVDKGVTIFRVDNPHTKPVAFWEWLIAEVQSKHPNITFLAEAFTRPKMMKMLAKTGFSQSYTYFTWRNFKHELMDYFSELTTSPVNEYFRGNLFTSTPDILPFILQEGGPPAFKIRAVLAATLSSVYGMYSGYELCENTPITGKEEYLNSEKYEHKVWDWDRPGNIIPYITQINAIRRDNEALHHYNNLKFYHAENDNILFYGKMNRERSNIILVVVNINPFEKHDSFIYLPLEEFNIKPTETYQVHDLLNNERYLWRGSKNYVSLDPKIKPAHIFKIRRWSHRENDFDYFI